MQRFCRSRNENITEIYTKFLIVVCNWSRIFSNSKIYSLELELRNNYDDIILGASAPPFSSIKILNTPFVCVCVCKV